MSLLLRPAGRNRLASRRALERLERRTALGLLIVQALAPGTRSPLVADRDAGCRGVVGPVPRPLWMNAFGGNATTALRARHDGLPRAGAPRAPAADVRLPGMRGEGLELEALVAAKARSGTTISVC